MREPTGPARSSQAPLIGLRDQSGQLERARGLRVRVRSARIRHPRSRWSAAPDISNAREWQR
jgi:hypothetical protein